MALDEAKKQQIIVQLNAAVIGLLQGVGNALTDDGRISVAEGGVLASQAALFGFGMAAAARGLSGEEWGEVIAAWSAQVGM